MLGVREDYEGILSEKERLIEQLRNDLRLKEREIQTMANEMKLMEESKTKESEGHNQIVEGLKKQLEELKAKVREEQLR